jgi:ribosomal protein S18 acetylase RimI-like enzyme
MDTLIPLTVRAGRPDDAGALIDLQIRMALETEDLALDRPTVERGVAAVFADPSKGEYWLAEVDSIEGIDDKIAGCLLVTREWSDWRDGTVLWVQSVFVVPEARGRGVYKSLWKHLQARVEASPDLKGIRLYVDKRNRAAQQVYERLGMTREHYELFEWLK